MIRLAQAVRLAEELHAGQTDRQGLPYVLHPMRVMIRLSELGAEVETLAVALLHDVIEDTPATLESLAAAGASPAQLAALDALTRREGETYGEFILRAKADPIARVVKPADILDNLNPARASGSNPGLRRRYLSALEVLGVTLKGDEWG